MGSVTKSSEADKEQEEMGFIGKLDGNGMKSHWKLLCGYGDRIREPGRFFGEDWEPPFQ